MLEINALHPRCKSPPMGMPTPGNYTSIPALLKTAGARRFIRTRSVIPHPLSEAAASSRGLLTWGAPLPEKRKPKSKDPKPETWKSTAEIYVKAGLLTPCRGRP